MKPLNLLFALLRAAPAIIAAVKKPKPTIAPPEHLKRAGLTGGYPPEDGGAGAVERAIDHVRPRQG